MKGEKNYFYVGTYSKNNEEGLFLVSADEEMNMEICETVRAASPSYLHTDERKRLLYAVSETESYKGGNGGSIICYRIEANYKLKKLVQLPTLGKFPCHLKKSADGKFLYVANYGEGTAVIYTLDKEGVPYATHMVINHNTTEMSAHVHFTGETPDGKFLCAADLGLDAVFFYDKNKNFEKSCVFKTAENSGPRQIKFYGSNAYILNEKSSDIYVLKESGAQNSVPFELIQKISVLPEKEVISHASAELKISHKGQYVFASLRFENGIAVFKRNSDGTLNKINFLTLKGDCPRYFCFSPNEKFMLIGLEKSEEIMVYKFDSEHGILSDTGKSLKIPSPVCFRFIQY